MPFQNKQGMLRCRLPMQLRSGCRKFCSEIHSGSESIRRLKIGDISVEIVRPKRPEFVPIGYVNGNESLSTLRHLKWLLQKDTLRQDVFLMGIPGSTRRNLIMQYLELSRREYEYLALTRDTTEADIKQRKELTGGTGHHVDLCAVRAAIFGRVLILDGVEKTERNVLPVLNNLLENREMQLDDGRFLIKADKYDRLEAEHGRDSLNRWKLVRVSEHFHVVALGVPVPRFRGHTLDPPFRSRFQARHVVSANFGDQLSLLKSLAPSIDANRIASLLAFVHGLMSDESASLGMPQFPIDSLPVAVLVWNRNPTYSAETIIQLLYPYKLMLKSEAQENVNSFMVDFDVKDDLDQAISWRNVTSIEKSETVPNQMAIATISWSDQLINLPLTVGSNSPCVLPNEHYVATRAQEHQLCDLLFSHSAGDLCLLGAKGCGKSVLINRLARLLGYEPSVLQLYQVKIPGQDMTSRELVQRRRMLPSGDTVWQPSILVDAARNGRLAVLDGLHRLHHSTVNTFQRLVHDRQLELNDGSRLIDEGRFRTLMTITGMTKEQLNKSQIFAIDPAFRIIALAEPPNPHDGPRHWLTSEMLTMFLFHTVKSLSINDEKTVLSSLIPGLCEKTVDKLLTFVGDLRESRDSNLRSLSDSLSTRQLIRIMRRLTAFPDESLNSAIHKACLSRFLPQLTKSALNEALMKAKIRVIAEREINMRCENKDGLVYIGDTQIEAYKPTNRTMVPDIVFYENEQHVRLLESMLRDWILANHLLLIGDQGVGKNKLVDRFLQLLDRPRQYLQLNRDTTVTTLTVQSTVVDGRLSYEDSPLVTAIRQGQVLVIDEADKAPTHVTCVLKSLLEDGTMHLADGRTIVPHSTDRLCSSENTIRMHADFRAIVLANRPGFPFLGNDFFGALGDLFSVHSVDNPSRSSQLAMLRRYGPDVPDRILRQLVGVFDELRRLVDEGELNYPYSTRELVNIVRHLQHFPDDNLANVVGNVFDFDAFSSETMESLVSVLRKHGIPIDNDVISNQHWRMCRKSDSKTSVHFYEHYGHRMKSIDFDSELINTRVLPGDDVILHCMPIDEGKFLIHTNKGHQLLTLDGSDHLQPVPSTGHVNFDCASGNIIPEDSISSLIDQEMHSSGRFFSADDYLALISIGFPDSLGANSIFGLIRPNDKSFAVERPYWASESTAKLIHPDSRTAFLNGQIVRSVPIWRIPTKVVDKDVNLNQVGGFLEVVDLVSKQTTYIPVPMAKFPVYNTAWSISLMEPAFVVSPAKDDCILTVDSSGGIRLWETDFNRLNASLLTWRKMFDIGNDDQLRIEYEKSETDADLSKLDEPKVGKFDSTGAAHFGGGTWAGGTERQWIRHQTSGDLDESKLVDGLTGEKTIFRRRVDVDVEPGSPLVNPKRLRMCVDVSGSMYRFDGHDQRLQRTLQTCLMVIDALHGHGDIAKYDIVGHSGDQPDVMFVEKDRPPKDDKQRLDVLQKMIAHSQFCLSGDHTLEAAQLAIDQLVNEREEADERLVVVISDANLNRYGIGPGHLKRVMNSDERVNMFVVFIGSLGEQADQLRRSLPVGRTFICEDSAEIPHIMRLIFASTMFGGERN